MADFTNTKLNNKLARIQDIDAQTTNCLGLILSPDQETFNRGLT